VAASESLWVMALATTQKQQNNYGCTGCGKTKKIVIPRHASCRGISHSFDFKPRRDSWRSLSRSLPGLEMARRIDFFRGLFSRWPARTAPASTSRFFSCKSVPYFRGLRSSAGWRRNPVPLPETSAGSLPAKCNAVASPPPKRRSRKRRAHLFGSG